MGPGKIGQEYNNWVLSSKHFIIAGVINQTYLHRCLKSQMRWTHGLSRLACRFSSSCMMASRLIMSWQSSFSSMSFLLTIITCLFKSKNITMIWTWINLRIFSRSVTQHTSLFMKIWGCWKKENVRRLTKRRIPPIRNVPLLVAKTPPATTMNTSPSVLQKKTLLSM